MSIRIPLQPGDRVRLSELGKRAIANARSTTHYALELQDAWGVLLSQPWTTDVAPLEELVWDVRWLPANVRYLCPAKYLEKVNET